VLLMEGSAFFSKKLYEGQIIEDEIVTETVLQASMGCASFWRFFIHIYTYLNSKSLPEFSMILNQIEFR